MSRDAAPDVLRLDKWLWFARLARTRSLAARLCADGRVAVGGHAVKPHHPVRIGDTVTLDWPEKRRFLTIRALGARRGPAAEARLLYDEAPAPALREAAAPAWTSLFVEEA